MQAITVRDRNAGVGGLSLTDMPYPQAGQNDVIVRVHAGGFTPGELDWPTTWADRAGHDRTPSVPGHELSGVVVELGYGTTGLTVGQRVFGLIDWSRNGSLAEYTAVEARNLAPLPADVDHLVAELVTDALVMAFQRRRPDQRVVHHSDRGAAYTSLAFSRRVVELEVDQSFGSTGDCYDNAAVESFFATLKRELAWIHATKNWPTRAALRSALFDYIEGFYNPERIQRRLGHQSPINYEQDSAA
jgi:Integrase core domain/Alcohol dehydrogenase GroES-like domain